MLAKLIPEYKHKSRIYLSWDAASWHMSKMTPLRTGFNDINQAGAGRTRDFASC